MKRRENGRRSILSQRTREKTNPEGRGVSKPPARSDVEAEIVDRHMDAETAPAAADCRGQGGIEGRARSDSQSKSQVTPSPPISGRIEQIADH